MRELSEDLLRTEPDEVASYLRKLGYKVTDVDKVFEEIARENGIASSELFKELSRKYEVFVQIRERR